MLNQKVVIRGPINDLFGKDGIIVAIKSCRDSRDGTQCKVLVGEKISDWIPCEWLEEANKAYHQIA